MQRDMQLAPFFHQPGDDVLHTPSLYGLLLSCCLLHAGCLLASHGMATGLLFSLTETLTTLLFMGPPCTDPASAVWLHMPACIPTAWPHQGLPTQGHAQRRVVT